LIQRDRPRPINSNNRTQFYKSCLLNYHWAQFHAPVEIAASKVAFAARIDRTKDLQDIKFIQEKFGNSREEILQKLFTIERETHRRSAIMVWNQLERLIAEIPERLMEFEKQKEVIVRLEDEALKTNRLAKTEEQLRRQKQTPEQDQELGQSL
jgi:hypothetical protein